MIVQVKMPPSGYIPGDPMVVDVGDGRRIECHVPRGVKKGETFHVVVDKLPPKSSGGDTRLL